MNYAKLGVGLGALFLFALFGFLYSRETIFRVSKVEISGIANAELLEDVEHSLFPLHGRPLFSVALEDVQKTLFEFPRIQDVRIMRIWPSTLSLQVQERYAVAAEFREGVLHEVDKFGQAFIELSKAKPLPLLTGLMDNPLLRTEVLRWLATELEAEKSGMLAGEVSEIRWSQESGLIAEMPQYRLSVHLPTRGLEDAWSQVNRARNSMLAHGQIPHLMDAVSPDRVFIYQSSRLQKFESGINLKELVRRVRDESPKAR